MAIVKLKTASKISGRGVAGEEIAPTVNGEAVVARKVIWSRDGERLRVDLRPPGGGAG
jgi:hypothetical protein